MNKASDKTKDTGRAKPFRITVLCNREGRGYFSAQRHFPSGKPIVLEVLPQEEDPAPPAGQKVNPTHIGLRSHRQLMDEPFLSVRDGGEFPAAAQADASGPAPALSPEIQAKLQQLLDLDLGALGSLPGRMDALLDVAGGGDPDQLKALQDGLVQLRDVVEKTQDQLATLQDKVDVLHPGEVDKTGATESVATLAGQVADLQAAVEAIPSQLDGLAKQVQDAVEMITAPDGDGTSEAPPAPAAGDTTPPAPQSAADKAKAAKAEKAAKASAPK